MKIDILTIFPKMFSGPFNESMVKRAQDEKLVDLKIHDLRDWSTDNHRSVDDAPYGGGPGMIMRVDVIDRAVQSLVAVRPKPGSINGWRERKGIPTAHSPESNSAASTGGREASDRTHNGKIILLDTKGKFYTQQHARKLATEKHLILIAGHYEGIDHRVHDHIVDEVFSIGPYVLTGGELPTMVVVDSVVRLFPGVLGNPESLAQESYSPSKSSKLKAKSNLEYPQYTRPEVYQGWKVPEVLLSGNHKRIEAWRKPQQRNYSTHR